MSAEISMEKVRWWIYNETTPLPLQLDRHGSLVTSQMGGNFVHTDIWSDAWGRQKVVKDQSLFHSLFTFNIPSTWLIFEDGTEVANSASTRVTSVDWHASIKSWTTATNTWFLRGKRHPRYQPNRWHLFSTAWFLPSPTATWIRDLWLLNTIIEVSFHLEDWVLYAHIVNDSVVKVKEAIDLSAIWLTVADLANWHLYDIQFQWRWVWDYFFYIDQKLVYKTSFLWANTDLTIYNPALSAWFKSENTDWTEVEIIIGCVDISSEWWFEDEAEYRSMANITPKAVNTANYPVLIMNVKETFNSLPNTRDIQAYRATWSSDQKSYMKAYITRDATAITWASFNDVQTDSWMQYDVAATAIDTAKCQLLWNTRLQIDTPGQVDLPSGKTSFYLTAWDYLIITVERESPTQTANAVVSLEVWEEI